jgi:hypothetical protein
VPIYETRLHCIPEDSNHKLLCVVYSVQIDTVLEATWN